MPAFIYANQSACQSLHRSHFQWEQALWNFSKVGWQLYGPLLRLVVWAPCAAQSPLVRAAVQCSVCSGIGQLDTQGQITTANSSNNSSYNISSNSSPQIEHKRLGSELSWLWAEWGLERHSSSCTYPLYLVVTKCQAAQHQGNTVRLTDGKWGFIMEPSIFLKSGKYTDRLDICVKSRLLHHADGRQALFLQIIGFTNKIRNKHFSGTWKALLWMLSIRGSDSLMALFKCWQNDTNLWRKRFDSAVVNTWILSK